MKNVFLIIALLTLSACAANGPQYDPSKLPPIAKREAQVFVYRPSGFVYSGIRADVDVNGQKCAIPTNSWAVFNLSSPAKITSEFWNMPGVSKIELPVEEGRRYYVRMSPDTGNSIAGVSAGILGMMASEATTENSGPLNLTVVAKENADKELTSAKRSCP